MGSSPNLVITTQDGRTVDMDLGYDWREREPARLAVGPVLNVEDAVATKINALYSRQEARDYIDVDAIRSSGRFTDAELIAATARRDAGFETPMFIRQLERIERIEPIRFEEYGVDAAALQALTARFLAWATELRSPEPAAPASEIASAGPELTPATGAPAPDPEEQLRATLRARRDAQYPRGASITSHSDPPTARRDKPGRGPTLGR